MSTQYTIIILIYPSMDINIDEILKKYIMINTIFFVINIGYIGTKWYLDLMICIDIILYIFVLKPSIVQKLIIPLITHNNSKIQNLFNLSKNLGYDFGDVAMIDMLTIVVLMTIKFIADILEYFIEMLTFLSIIYENENLSIFWIIIKYISIIIYVYHLLRSVFFWIKLCYRTIRFIFM